MLGCHHLVFGRHHTRNLRHGVSQRKPNPRPKTTQIEHIPDTINVLPDLVCIRPLQLAQLCAAFNFEVHFVSRLGCDLVGRTKHAKKITKYKHKDEKKTSTRSAHEMRNNSLPWCLSGRGGLLVWRYRYPVPECFERLGVPLGQTWRLRNLTTM